MALTVQKQTVLNNLLLKTTAFIIGYSIWAALSGHQTLRVTKEIPIAFYNVPDSWRIQAPETLKVQVCAKRDALRRISPENLTAHLDAATLHQGENRIHLHDASFFVAKQIAVDHVDPLIVHVSWQA